MSSKLIAGTTSGTALNMSADTSGILEIQTGSTPTTAITVDASQNVGIGTSSPATKLDVVGTIRASQSLAFGTNGTSGVGTIYSDSNWGCLITAKQASPAVADFMWQNGSSVERMRIDSSGNLLVGTTAQLGSEKAAFVSGSASAVITLRYSGATAGRYTRLACDGNNAIFIIDNNGTGQYQNYGSSSWTATSDERFKDIIEPITDAVNKVSTLRSVIGKLKTDPEGTRKSFLIAQDVQKVLPEAVDATDPEKLGVSYTDIIPLLVASIKELNAKVDAQAAEIKALKGNTPQPADEVTK